MAHFTRDWGITESLICQFSTCNATIVKECRWQETSLCTVASMMLGEKCTMAIFTDAMIWRHLRGDTKVCTVTVESPIRAVSTILTERFHFPCVLSWPCCPWCLWCSGHLPQGQHQPPEDGWPAWFGWVLAGTHYCPPVKAIITLD